MNLKLGDKLEVDHRLARRFGGRNETKNYQLLHLHCHDVKTAEEIKACAGFEKGIGDNDYVIEEPCELETLTHGFEDEVQR